ncbi:MAG: hypothetical protein KZQ66_04845 [Candidatus Thiodiazotropha sp. (ex Lucinoma aequizonata)]|nr:hypothetical protein [Candidatus Thiodiazotropha sp. (ex Lucinoma aequizonata)]MCU7898129.1 hypothetical protein [Candidatus Thiodiazotropha sp. (ex Lucinoma aequizonata)]MCU7901402.1 hypothetical protein [Candidatus Thiodiazotropha sp. (ex Lucinoma aequizonata)]MCU7910782.1 hypothetical protein [Candidatus Thiodiazotropha sp. (ex Lucinoma aequizonata)]
MHEQLTVEVQYGIVTYAGRSRHNRLSKIEVIIQLKNWKKCLTRFFCIFSDFKEDCLPVSITIHTSSKRLAMAFFM